MKVLVINSSPRMDTGNTHLILNPFMRGMEEAGAEVDIVFTQKLKLEPCTGEYHCMFKSPGVCYIQDDMQTLYPKLGGSDIWVFATPNYSSAITSKMKIIFERLCPLAEPFFVLYDGLSGYCWRDTTKVSKVVLVSSCAFVELENFDPLIAHVKTFCSHIGKNGVQTEYVGALLRPNAGYFRAMNQNGGSLNDIFEAARNAGFQLISTGSISSDTLQLISRDLTQQPKEEVIETINQSISTAMQSV